MKKLTAILLLICLTAALPVQADTYNEQVGMNVSGFSSNLITGEAAGGQMFSEYPVSVVMYWATWNTDSVSQLRLLQQITDEHPEYGVFALLKVDATSTVDAALSIAEQNGYSFPIIVCDEVWQTVVEKAPFMPQYFLVNGSGVIVEVWHSAFSGADILLDRLSYWSATSTMPDGDIDYNGTVDMADGLLLLRCALGISSVNETIMLHGDLDGDGVITVNDSLILVRIVLGIIN